MSSEEKRPESASSPTSEPDDTPRNTIRVIKSGDTDDTVVEVKVAGESETKVTVFGGESPKSEKQEQVTTTPSENAKKETKSDEDEQNKEDDTKKFKYVPKPLSQDEIDNIVKQYAKMDERDLKKYLDFFWTVDDNKLGFFTIQQLEYHLNVKGCYYTSRQIASMFADIDHNNDMLISLQEYLTEMSKNKRRPRTADEMKDLFKFFDQNEDGFVCREDIIAATKKLNQPVSEYHISTFLSSDVSGRGGKLDFQSFSIAVKRLKL